jgi:hypothetical protein
MFPDAAAAFKAPMIWGPYFGMRKGVSSKKHRMTFLEIREMTISASPYAIAN